MKKTFKVIYGLMLAAGLMLSMSIFAHAEGIDYKNYKGFVYTTYNAKEGSVQVINYKGNKKSITVPEKIKGKKVQMISSLKDAKKLRTLKLSKVINYARVSEAPVLKKITVSKSNKLFSVKNNLLLNKKQTVVKSCPGGLITVNVPDTVKTVAHLSFVGAKAEKVALGKNVTHIESYAFSKCKNLKKITLNRNLKKIEGFAFEKCESLKEISIPKNVTKIGDYTFSQCKNLEKVTFEGAILNRICYDAFYGCKNLKEVYMLNLEKTPVLAGDEEMVFGDTKEGINFYVKNETVAKGLKKQLEGSGVKNANIYAEGRLIYKNVN